MFFMNNSAKLMKKNDLNKWIVSAIMQNKQICNVIINFYQGYIRSLDTRNEILQ